MNTGLNCCPVNVATFIPLQETVTNGRKKHNALPAKISTDAMVFRFGILSPSPLTGLRTRHLADVLAQSSHDGCDGQRERHTGAYRRLLRLALRLRGYLILRGVGLRLLLVDLLSAVCGSGGGAIAANPALTGGACADGGA